MGNFQKPTEGRHVTFTPSKSTQDKKFKGKHKKTYPGVVTDVNADSIDITVFGNGEMVFVKNIKHASEAEVEKSYWDWPERVSEPDTNTDHPEPTKEG